MKSYKLKINDVRYLIEDPYENQLNINYTSREHRDNLYKNLDEGRVRSDYDLLGSERYKIGGVYVISEIWVRRGYWSEIESSNS